MKFRAGNGNLQWINDTYTPILQANEPDVPAPLQPMVGSASLSSSSSSSSSSSFCPSSSSDGYVYIMTDRPDRFKVGCSSHTCLRERQFRTGNLDIQLKHSFPVKNMQSAESQAHHDLEQKHIKLEWFCSATPTHYSSASSESQKKTT